MLRNKIENKTILCRINLVLTANVAFLFSVPIIGTFFANGLSNNIIGNVFILLTILILFIHCVLGALKIGKMRWKTLWMNSKKYFELTSISYRISGARVVPFLSFLVSLMGVM